MMSDAPYLKFDPDQQLKQIEIFTQQQQDEVTQLINDSQKHFSADAFEAGSDIQEQVSGMINDIESQLENEISKINQQLQSLLPNQTQ